MPHQPTNCYDQPPFGQAGQERVGEDSDGVLKEVPLRQPRCIEWINVHWYNLVASILQPLQPG